MTLAHFVAVLVGVKIMDEKELEGKVVIIPANKLLELLDSAMGVFQAVDDFYTVFDKFIRTQMSSDDLEEQIEEDNVIDINRKRINKDPNEVYNNKE